MEIVCPSCKSKNVTAKIKTSGAGKPPEARLITKCKDCGSLRSNPNIDYEIKNIVNESIGGEYFNI